MSQLHIEESVIINASAQTLYGIITDYEVGHPAILPKPFEGLQVDKGGRGAGTEITVFVNVFGVKQSFRQRVSEPEPGRVVRESNIGDDLVTHFIFEPLHDGKQTKVSITTDFTPKNFMERLLNPALMRSMYKKELHNLAAYAMEQEQLHGMGHPLPGSQ